MGINNIGIVPDFFFQRFLDLKSHAFATAVLQQNPTVGQKYRIIAYTMKCVSKYFDSF